MKLKKSIAIDKKLIEIIEDNLPNIKLSRVMNQALIEYLEKHEMLTEKDKLELL